MSEPEATDIDAEVSVDELDNAVRNLLTECQWRTSEREQFERKLREIRLRFGATSCEIHAAFNRVREELQARQLDEHLHSTANRRIAAAFCWIAWYFWKMGFLQVLLWQFWAYVALGWIATFGAYLLCAATYIIIRKVAELPACPSWVAFLFGIALQLEAFATGFLGNRWVYLSLMRSFWHR